MRRLRILCAVLALSGSGCAYNPSVLAPIGEARRAVGDAAMDYLCRLITVDEWQQRFGRHLESVRGWVAICGTAVQAPPTSPEPSTSEGTLL
jgi:hypothetical protein